MLLDIHHTTNFKFSDPMRYIVQSHRLQPAQSDGQRILKWSVEAEGAQFGSFFTDGAGDQIRTMTFEGPVDELAVTVNGRIEVENTKGILQGHKETIRPDAYLRHTDVTKPDDALKALAGSVQADGDQLKLAHALSNAVGEAISYQTGSTSATTSAAQALAQGAGVCQDFAHSLICVARIAELPARYVSGYLNATEDVSSDEAGHAWAEIFVKGLGWVGFDASNRCCPDENYIRLGSGLDAVHAAPIRGVTIGVGQENMNVQVAVSAIQQ